MITISDVPTNTPIPIVDISRSWEEDRLMESGNAPARKELSTISVRQSTSAYCKMTYASAITTLKMSNIKRPSNILTPYFDELELSRDSAPRLRSQHNPNIAFILASRTNLALRFLVSGTGVVVASLWSDGAGEFILMNDRSVDP